MITAKQHNQISASVYKKRKEITSRCLDIDTETLYIQHNWWLAVERKIINDRSLRVHLYAIHLYVSQFRLGFSCITSFILCIISPGQRPV